ncbi:hypothetical protein Tco_0722404 [Tanacetum coccineum]
MFTISNVCLCDRDVSPALTYRGPAHYCNRQSLAKIQKAIEKHLSQQTTNNTETKSASTFDSDDSSTAASVNPSTRVTNALNRGRQIKIPCPERPNEQSTNPSTLHPHPHESQLLRQMKGKNTESEPFFFFFLVPNSRASPTRQSCASVPPPGPAYQGHTTAEPVGAGRSKSHARA